MTRLPLTPALLIKTLQTLALFISLIFMRSLAFAQDFARAWIFIYRSSHLANFHSQIWYRMIITSLYICAWVGLLLHYFLGVFYFVVVIPLVLFIFVLALVLWIAWKSSIFIYLSFNSLVSRSSPGLSRMNVRRVNLIRAQALETRVSNALGLRAIPRRRYERTLLLKARKHPQGLNLQHARTITHSRRITKLVLDQDDAYCFYAEPDYETRQLAKFQGYCLRNPTLEAHAYTMYKRVDQKIKPVSTQMPPEASVTRTIPEDPLITLSKLPFFSPDFVPTAKLTTERLASLNINKGFLLPEEEKLFTHVMKLNERALAFEDIERGTLSDAYFSDYVIPTIPHRPWEYRNMPIPPGIMEQVLDVLKLKIDAGVYEPSESSYRSRWFCVVKKNGKL